MPRRARHPDFCCAGCAAVFELLQNAGLDRFYELRSGPGQAVGAVPEPARHDWLTELEENGRLAGEQVRVRLDVQGIHCAACVWVLQELWRRHDGALQIDLNPSLGQVVLVYDRSRLRLAAYLDEVERLGYRMAPASKHADDEDRGLLMRLGVCVALAMNAMMFALAGYVGMSAADAAVHDLFGWLAVALATGAVVVGGPVFFRGALAGLRRRVLHLDLPISLGIVLAYGASLSGFVSGGGDGYFDTVTVFVTLMLTGRFVQRRAVRKNRDWLLRNDGAEHLRVRRLRDGALATVGLDAVRVGDRLLLAPGDLVPARGRLLDHPEAFSLDWILGESQPRAFAAGEAVPAGAFHAGRQPAMLEVDAGPRESGLLELLSAPPASADDLASDGFWAAVNRWYVTAVLVLAALGGALWLVLDPSRALGVTTSILVVTCPCALGLAIPLAFQLAVAGLRRRGVFVRTTALLDKARSVRKVVFDKTGTVTWGGMRAVQMRAPDPSLRDLLLTMASSSSHPVSRAIVEVLSDGTPLRFLADVSVVEQIGCGLETTWRGHRYRLGSAAFCFGEAGSKGDGLCVFTRDGHVEACFALEEDVRDGFADEVASLRAAGCSVFLLTGDRRARALRVARNLGLPEDAVHADAKPADKAAFVRNLDHHDTMMVGDGLNDAAAFEAAYCAGTPAVDRPVMPARADFFFRGGGSGAVSALLRTAGRFHHVVTANLWLAGVYNVAALGLSFAGLMNPLLCAVLMPLSSLVLLGHTTARMRVEPEGTHA